MIYEQRNTSLASAERPTAHNNVPATEITPVARNLAPVILKGYEFVSALLVKELFRYAQLQHGEIEELVFQLIASTQASKKLGQPTQDFLVVLSHLPDHILAWIKAEAQRGMGRRKFLKRTIQLALVGAVGVGIAEGVFWPQIVSEIFKDNLGERFKELQARIFEKYGVVVTSSIDGSIYDTDRQHTEITSAVELLWATRSVEMEFQKYPPDYFRNNGFQKVIIRKSIDTTWKGEVSGLGGAKEILLAFRFGLHQGGVPFPMGLDGLLHHELYHSVEGWSEATTIDQRNTHWHEHFPPGEKGYQGGNAVEDRARLAALFMSTGFIPEVLYENEYGNIQKKEQKIKEDFFKWSKGKMDEQYWEDFKWGKVTGDYWSQREHSPQ